MMNITVNADPVKELKQYSLGATVIMKTTTTVIQPLSKGACWHMSTEIESKVAHACSLSGSRVVQC